MWKKVVTPTILVSLFWVAVSFATTYYIFWLGHSHARMLAENVAPIRAVASMQDALWRLQDAAPGLGDPGLPRLNDRESFDELEAQFERALVAAEQSATSATEQALVKEIRRHFSAFRDALHGAPPVRSQPATARGSLGRVAFSQLARAVAKPCQELVLVNERMMAEAMVRTARLENLLLLARMAALIAGPAIGIFLGIRIARRLDRSLSQISVTLNDATGELDQEIGRVEFTPSAEGDDLSALSRQVQLISSRIKQVLFELHNARTETVRSDRLALVGELAAGVAHELRNPLTSVKLLIQTAVRNGASRPPNAHELQIVLQEISRMEETIQGLLDFARPGRLHRIPHDLRDTLRRALNLVAGRADHEHVRIDERFAGQPLFVDGDPEQLHQVFVNLLINGIESMPRGGLLQIEADIADDGQTFRLVFSDAGQGIPLELLERIFEPFVTNEERGTGLGLAICRRIVQAHGGLISAVNRLDGGAAFSVQLPACHPLPADSERANEIRILSAERATGRGEGDAELALPMSAQSGTRVGPE